MAGGSQPLPCVAATGCTCSGLTDRPSGERPTHTAPPAPLHSVIIGQRCCVPAPHPPQVTLHPIIAHLTYSLAMALQEYFQLKDEDAAAAAAAVAQGGAAEANAASAKVGQTLQGLGWLTQGVMGTLWDITWVVVVANDHCICIYNDIYIHIWLPSRSQDTKSTLFGLLDVPLTGMNNATLYCINIFGTSCFPHLSKYSTSSATCQACDRL